MTEKEFKEIQDLLQDTLKLKTQVQRKLAIDMIINVLREKVIGNNGTVVK